MQSRVFLCYCLYWPCALWCSSLHSVIADIGDKGHPPIVRYNDGLLYLEKMVLWIDP
jgi:hypothetical protein